MKYFLSSECTGGVVNKRTFSMFYLPFLLFGLISDFEILVASTERLE